MQILLLVIPVERVFERIQESLGKYLKPDSGIYSKTHKTGMTVFTSIAEDVYNGQEK